MSYLIILCVFSYYIALYFLSCTYIKLFRGTVKNFKLTTAQKLILQILLSKSRANFNLNMFMFNESVYKFKESKFS